ncbi:MAG: hypothetical protein ACRCT7_16430 [Shewanella sp.]
MTKRMAPPLAMAVIGHDRKKPWFSAQKPLRISAKISCLSFAIAQGLHPPPFSEYH